MNRLRHFDIILSLRESNFNFLICQTFELRNEDEMKICAVERAFIYGNKVGKSNVLATNLSLLITPISSVFAP